MGYLKYSWEYRPLPRNADSCKLHKKRHAKCPLTCENRKRSRTDFEDLRILANVASAYQKMEVKHIPFEETPFGRYLFGHAAAPWDKIPMNPEAPIFVPRAPTYAEVVTGAKRVRIENNKL